MTQDPSDDKEMLENFAQALQEVRPADKRVPPVTDQDILRAMLGKPFNAGDAEPLPIRKAG
jgi:hypothetical protein